jgi:hypothetical protein
MHMRAAMGVAMVMRVAGMVALVVMAGVVMVVPVHL